MINLDNVWDSVYDFNETSVGISLSMPGKIFAGALSGMKNKVMSTVSVGGGSSGVSVSSSLRPTIQEKKKKKKGLFARISGVGNKNK